MKIVFCIDSLNKGGAERVISILANNFSNKNEVSIITTTSTKCAYTIDNSINLFSLDNEKVNALQRLKRPYRMYKLLKKLNPDIVICFMPSQSFRVLLVKPLFKFKTIVSVRNDPKMEFKPLKCKLVKFLFYNRSDGFVFQTEDAKNYFNKKIQSRSIIIPNPIKQEFIDRKVYTGKKENVIVSVGRLEPQKNHELLIDAFYDIKDKFKNYKLIIYGEGYLREKLEKKIEKLGMKDRILLPGNVDNIAEKLEKAKLFVLTSNYEGMPNALMEAMALSLPCISTDCPCGGPKFLIKDNKNGILVDVGDIEKLKDLLVYVIQNLNTQKFINIKNNSRKEMQKYTVKNICSKWYDYIKNIHIK